MPSPNPAELARASAGSDLRPKSASRDLRRSMTARPALTATVGMNQQQLGTTGNFVRVFPAVAEFINIEPNVTHVLTVTVVNRTDRVRRIRCKPPGTREFTLHQIPSVAVAPGLEISADLEFFTEVEGDFLDEIIVMCEDDRIAVPIVARAPRAELVFDGYCVFGPIAPGAQTIRYIDVVNKGHRPAEFEILKRDPAPFKIEPMQGRLGPADSDECFLRIKVTFETPELGVQRSIAEVKVNGKVIGTVIDMSANVVRQQLEIVSAEGSGRAEVMQFGTVFVGETRTQQCMVVNDGPEPTQFHIQVPKQDGIEYDEPVWTVTPPQGILAPLEQRLLTCVFHPPLIAVSRGFQAQSAHRSTEDHEVVVVCMGVGGVEDMSAQVKLTGRAAYPKVSLAHHSLEFIKTATNESIELSTTIKNSHEDLPVTFRIERVPHFKIRPATGRLLPHQSMELVVSFAPNQLGTHKCTFKAILAGGQGHSIGEMMLGVMGICDREGSKDLKGGLTATEETFKPTMTFQDQWQLEAQKKMPPEKFTRDKHWEKFPPMVDNESIDYTFGPDKFEEKAANKQVYVDMIRQRHAQRNADMSIKETQAFALGAPVTDSGDPKNDPDYARPAVDMGLIGLPVKGISKGQALREPWLALPAVDEPLFLKQGGGAAIKPRSRVMDENRLIRRKLKAEPSNARERKECGSIMRPEQILAISTHPSNMEFGSVCIQADTSKSFTISNDSQQHVRVQIDTLGNRSLAKSTPEAQVLPPGATAGFDITLYLESKAEVDTRFAYIINGHHRYEVPVKAQAVPVMLSLSKATMSFFFPEHSLEQVVTDTVHLLNPGNTHAEFKIISSEHFKAFPASGTVEPNAAEEISIRYNPGASSAREEKLTVQVVGGAPLELTCKGNVPEVVLASKSRSVDFGPLAAGSSLKKSVALTCAGKAAAVFYVDQDELRVKCPGLSVLPEKGMVFPGAGSQLVFTVKSEQALKIDSSIVVHVRGGKALKLVVKADFIVPDVSVQNDEIDFGPTYLGAQSVRDLVVVNASSIPAILTLDLRKHPEFSARIPPDLEVEEEESLSALSSLRPKGKGIDPDEELEASGPSLKFKVPASGQAQIEFIYAPVSINPHAFELPLLLQGMPPSAAKQLRRAVIAEGDKPRLLLSSLVVDFEKKVVINDQMKGFSYSMEVTLTNCDDMKVHVDASLRGGDSEGGAPLFRMDNCSQELDVGAACNIKIWFIPKTDGTYKCSLCVFLDHNMDHPYFDVDVIGSGVYPSLGFDRREVLFPTAPVGVPTTVTFWLLNHGYDNLSVRHQLPPDSASLPISINFPLGTMIGIVKKRIPVEVTFSAKKAMSFYAHLDFLDADGNKFSIPMVGTTDASILTTFPFMTIHKDYFEIDAKHGKPTTLQQRQALLDPVLSPEGKVMLDEAANATVGGKMSAAQLSINSEFICECAILSQSRSVGFVLDWANRSIFRQAVTRFPEDFVEQRGKHICDVVESATGKTVPGQKTRLSNNRKEEAQQALAGYVELSTFLKSFGALINTVKPEYLLSWELFQRLFMDQRGSQPMSEELAAFYEANYTLLNKGSWLIILYQTIKLFVVNRLTPRLLKSLPGVDPKKIVAPPTQGSNLYSQSEGILLAWLSYHHGQISPGERQWLSNFDEDLYDCRVFASVLTSHVPSLTEKVALVKKTKDKQERLANAQAVIEAMKELGLDYTPSPKDLISAPARDLVLFCTYLFNSMPGFIPKATVEFEGRLNDKVVKYIELSNPSSKPLTYSVRIQGSSEFTAADSLKLGAKEKFQFPVSCLHLHRRDAEAQVFFVSERPAGGSAGVTLVFGLKSTVKTFKRREIIVRETKLYDQISIDFQIENKSTEVDTEISLSLVNLTPTAKAEKGIKGSSKRGVTTSPLLPSMTFWLKPGKDKAFKLKRKAATSVQVQFLPLKMMGQSCLVFVEDAVHGEYCIEIQVKVELPSTNESCKFTHPMKSTIIREIPLTLRNSSIDKCRSSIMELLGQKEGKEWFKSLQDQNKLDYKVEYLTQHFAGPRDVIVTGKDAPATAAGGQEKNNYNKLPLELRPAGPGKYESRLILRSSVDIRVLDIEAVITSLGTRAELLFTCPARQSITQEIPIINRSDKLWIVQASLQGDRFKGGKDIQVPAMVDGSPGVANYPLTFSPAWICTSEGELTLRNTTVGDTYQYQLKGIGEDPVAEDHVSITCKARWRSSVKVSVRNLLGNQECLYKVECDLMGLSGSSELVVPANGTAEYELNVMMPRGGGFAGSITFIAPNHEYIWYTAEVMSENPPFEASITLETKARTAIAADIPIHNPLNQEITFDVLMEGEGLLGAPQITLRPKETTDYELIYSPLLTGEALGGLTFVNDTMGEFWYELRMRAALADRIEVLPVEAEIGKESWTVINIENPLGEEVEFEVVNSNPANFRVEADPEFEGIIEESESGPLVILPPYDRSSLCVYYTPTDIANQEHGLITLHHPTAGRWEFDCVGRGVLPSSFPETAVSSAVKQQSNNMLLFRNPFKRSITVQVKLVIEKEEEHASFALHTPAHEMTLGPGHDMDIGFVFEPIRMQEHRCAVVVTCMTEGVSVGSGPTEGFEPCTWVYPVVGTAEAPGTQFLGKFQCRARERIMQDLHLDLAGSVSGVGAVSNEVLVEIMPLPEHRDMLASSLRVEVLDPPSAASPDTCVVRMVFEPLKEIRTRVQLRATKATGGRWTFDIDLIATQADVDDTIKIQAMLNKTASVSFRMTNQFDDESPFRAYFSMDSAAEFSVSPSTGILGAYRSEGTNFVVSFKPEAYGKMYTGKLIVETDEMQWTYSVEGDQPKYEAPKDVQTKVASRVNREADPEVYKANKAPHNFMKDNASALKDVQRARR